MNIFEYFQEGKTEIKEVDVKELKKRIKIRAADMPKIRTTYFPDNSDLSKMNLTKFSDFIFKADNLKTIFKHNGKDRIEAHRKLEFENNEYKLKDEQQKKRIRDLEVLSSFKIQKCEDLEKELTLERKQLKKSKKKASRAKINRSYGEFYYLRPKTGAKLYEAGESRTYMKINDVFNCFELQGNKKQKVRKHPPFLSVQSFKKMCPLKEGDMVEGLLYFGTMGFAIHPKSKLLIKEAMEEGEKKREFYQLDVLLFVRMMKYFEFLKVKAKKSIKHTDWRDFVTHLESLSNVEKEKLKKYRTYFNDKFEFCNVKTQETQECPVHVISKK